MSDEYKAKEGGRRVEEEESSNERIELTLDYNLHHHHCCCRGYHHKNAKEKENIMTVTRFSNDDGTDGSTTIFHDLTGPSIKKQHFEPQKQVLPMFSSSYDDDDDDDVNEPNKEDEQARALAARDYLEKGGLLAEQGMFSEAISQWILGLSANPPPFEASRLWESRAQAHMALEEWFLAVQCAEFATQKDPSWADGFVTLGRAQLNLGEPSMAAASIQRALTIGLENKSDEEEAKQDLCYAKEQAAKAKAMRDNLPAEKRGCVLVREGQNFE